MALPKKGTRPTEVNGQQFRWKVSSYLDKYSLVVGSEAANKVIQVDLRPREYCNEDGELREGINYEYPLHATVLPKEVKAIIGEALAEGWPERGDLLGFKPKADLADFLVV